MSSDVSLRAVLLRLEEIVLPEAFVDETLHAYAHDHLPRWLAEHYHEPAVRDRVHRLLSSSSGDTSQNSGDALPLVEEDSWEHVREVILEGLHAMLHQDRVSREAEALREAVWTDGCRRGQIHAEIYDDVLRGLARWRAAGLVVASFSMTGAHAQRELFQCAEEGDLTPLLTAWFDARAGSLTEATAYRSMAEALGLDAGGILYVTNRPDEADAAVAAGLQALLVDRMGAVIPEGHAHRVEADLELV